MSAPSDERIDAAEAGTARPAVWRYRDVKDGKAERWTYSYGEPTHLPQLGFGRTWEVQPLYTSLSAVEACESVRLREALRGMLDEVDPHRMLMKPHWPKVDAARALLESETPQ